MMKCFLLCSVFLKMPTFTLTSFCSILIVCSLMSVPQVSSNSRQTSNLFSNRNSNSLRLRVRRSNLTRFSFYSIGVNNKEIGRNYSSLKDKPAYILPEPGCSCVPKIEDCDLECCYCKLVNAYLNNKINKYLIWNVISNIKDKSC